MNTPGLCPMFFLRSIPGFTALALQAFALLVLQDPASAQSQNPATLEEVRAIAKEAYIYGFPLVDNYRIQHSYFVKKGGKEYKAGWNTLVNNTRVYTPDDKAIQTPNSDTPYSYVGADLRAEPLVFTVPAVEKGRYYSLQFIDQYTFNFAYIGSRTTGSEAGSYLLTGPGWKGDKPVGIKSVIPCETEYAFILYRTQLFNPSDIEAVKKIQAGYQVQTLSQFLSQPAPAPAPAVEFVQPLTPQQQRTSLEFFSVLDFILRHCPPHPSEVKLREDFTRIGLGGSTPFSTASLKPEVSKALAEGMADAWAAFDKYKEKEIDTGKSSSADAFGSREFLKGRYLDRMSGAVLGIYGNSKDEAIYPTYFTDSSQLKLDGAHAYTLRFAPGQLPPVNAFWSLTLYELPASLLSANPLNRYLINSPMIPSLQKDPDGGITLFVQHESPGKDKESNWLPAPQAPFFMVLRLYWPQPQALSGEWKAPVLERKH